MKDYKTSTLNRDLTFSGPSTVEEYEAKGGPGSCVQDAVDGLIAWDTIPEFHSNLAPLLEKEFKITRGVDDKATEKAKARAKTEEAKAKVSVKEKLTSFIARVLATVSSEADATVKASNIATFDSLWKQAESATIIDPSPSKRVGRGPGKEYVERAETFLALPTDQLEAKITKIAELVPNVEETLVRDADGKPSVTSLAFAIKAWRDERDKQDGMSV